jgi:aspartyl-tRNA(Asn)/glutamyl-tRNA(Gln) amidotransferase subunit A
LVTASALEYKTVDVVEMSVFDTVESLFEEYDLLIVSTLMISPFKKSLLREQPGPLRKDRTSLDESLWGTFVDWCATQITNMTGHPAASAPAGFVDGLPVGMEIIGPRFREDCVLAASRTFERLPPWKGAYERFA